jgi:hypothetical protein
MSLNLVLTVVSKPLNRQTVIMYVVNVEVNGAMSVI